jgi:hypothetical protein
MTARLSIGIAAAAGERIARRVAREAEAAGLHALWVNDTPGHDALEILAAAAETTDRLVLATGVLPVDRRGAFEIVERVAELGLPVDRLVLGVGSGAGSAGALARVWDAVGELRAAQTLQGARVVVGALGPKMRRLGAEASHGLLLSWLTPELARVQRDNAHAIAPSASVALYVRAAGEPGAVGRLEEEAARYAAYPAYAANFARLGIQARDTVIRPESFTHAVAAYREAADEVVLRAIVPAETEDDYAGFVQAAAAAAHPR